MIADIKLDDHDLRRFLKVRGIDAELVYPGVPTPTVAAAARAVGVGEAAIVKSLVFLADGVPTLVVAAGRARIEMRRLAEAVTLSRRRLRFASPDQAHAITGFEVGAMPPFGHRQQLPTLVDRLSLAAEGIVFAGGGSRQALLKLSIETLIAATSGSWHPLTQGGHG